MISMRAIPTHLWTVLLALSLPTLPPRVARNKKRSFLIKLAVFYHFHDSDPIQLYGGLIKVKGKEGNGVEGDKLMLTDFNGAIGFVLLDRDGCSGSQDENVKEGSCSFGSLGRRNGREVRKGNAALVVEDCVECIICLCGTLTELRLLLCG